MIIRLENPKDFYTEDIYTGLVLKAHKFKAAENIQLCIGKRF